MKKLLFLIIAAGVVYLNYNNPTREDHEAFLYNELSALGPLSDDQFARVLKEIDFSNFLVCSATKTTMDNKMITFGFRKEIQLKNPVWPGETMNKLQKR